MNEIKNPVPLPDPSKEALDVGHLALKVLLMLTTPTCSCLCGIGQSVFGSTQHYVETRPPVIWTGKNEYGRVEIWVDGWWKGKKMKQPKKVF